MEKTKVSTREKVLIVALVIALAAAVCGFVLYFMVKTPSNIAAKYGNSTITEERVASWIDQYRVSSQLTNDDDFANALTSQNMTVAAFRLNVIDQLILADLVEAKAASLGISVSDDEVQAKLDEVKSSFGDDETWEATIENYGLTEADLRAQYKTNLLQDALCEKEVPTRDATDDEIISYMQNYLASTTQKHVYRVVFTGDDADTRAKACLAELNKAKEAGTLDAAAFEKIAKAESDEENVAETGGELGWTGSGKIGDEISEIIEYIAVGSLSDVESISDDNATEIFFIDTEYTFPESSEITSIDELEVPDELLDAVKTAAANIGWQSDCTAYLAKLLADTKVTYYPIPENAAYNVDLS